MNRSNGMTRHGARLAAIAATGLLTAAIFVLPAKADTDPKAVLATYADIALAKYEDALTTAKALDPAADALIAKPSAETLAAARDAWKAARIPYQQTEVYRFGNAIVDDWEGRVNAWPLDEGLIDYVDASYGAESDENTLYTANVIANPSIEINGQRSMPRRSRRNSCRARCRKPATSKPMSPPAITPSNSCSGART